MKELKIFNSNCEIHFSLYGAAIQKWLIKDTSLGEIDIVLGLDNKIDYKENHPCFGSIIGRCANRINKSEFNLNNKYYYLEKNEGQNHLHSGKENFAFKKWNFKQLSNSACSFSLFSPHLEGNYPGNLNIEVEYSLDEKNKLDIKYKASSDEDTIINLTNHTYFNLNGHKNHNILNHEFKIHASHFNPTNSESIPTGVIQSVSDSAFDLRSAKRLQIFDFDKIPLKRTRGIDHNYVLNNKKYSLAAEAFSEESKLHLQCFTDQEGLQLYLSNWLDNYRGKENAIYNQYQGFCFEAQAFPDSINHNHFPSIVLKKDSIYRQLTSYQISCI